MNRLAQDAAAHTYRDVEKLIYNVIHLFQRRFGGDFYELLSEANMAYLLALQSYRKDGGASFSTWTQTKVWYRLMDWLRGKMRQRRTEALDEDMFERKSEFSFEDFVAGLSPDARLVMRLTINTPTEILCVAVEMGGEPRNFKEATREFLRELGWANSRILESFEEIRKALL